VAPNCPQKALSEAVPHPSRTDKQRDLAMETFCDDKENLTPLRKLKSSSSPTKSHSYENLIFGSWGVEVVNKTEEPHCDFLPSLSRI
jgi:hypothetical protein